jgi:hypothetical protein
MFPAFSLSGTIRKDPVMLGGAIEEIFPEYSLPGKEGKDAPLVVMLGGAIEEMFPEYSLDTPLVMLGGVIEDKFP